MILQKLTKVDGHNHVALLMDDQTGVVSESSSHRHEIVWDESVGGWVVGFAADGHTHTLDEAESSQGLLSLIDEPEDEAKKVSDVLDLFSAWSELEEDSISRGREAESFIDGAQWSESEKSFLEKTQRASLVINKLERYIDDLSGWQRQNRTDIVYKPQEGGDQITADIATHLIKYDMEKSCFQREESKVFLDQVISGRGIWNIYLDRFDDVEGDIRFERYQWDDIVLGPHEKEDLSDCEGLIKHSLISKARLKLEYPTKAQDIETAFGAFSSGRSPSIEFNLDRDWANVGYGTTLLPTIEIAAKAFRVFECWRKYYFPVDIAFAGDGSFSQSLEGWSASERAAVRQFDNLVVIEKPNYRFRKTIVCAGVLLYDNFPEFAPAGSFPCVPVYAKKRRNKWKGKVETAMDAQRGLNKRYSQITDILNRMCSYGWFVEKNMFSHPQGVEEFKEVSSTPGFVAEVEDVFKLPKQVDGVKFPAEVVQLMHIDETGLQSLVNIEPSPSGANESGSHFMQQQKLRLLGNEYLFDHLSESKRSIGLIYLSMVQRYYSPYKISRILNSVKSKDASLTLGELPIENYPEEDIFQLIQNLDVTKYDVVVGESIYSPSARLSTFAVLTDLARAGQPIPPEAIIEFLDAPDGVKKRIQKSLTAQADAQAEAENRRMQIEENKTLIAKDIIPPEVQERMMPRAKEQ